MLVLRLRLFEETKQEVHFFQGLYDLEHAGPQGYDRDTLEAFLGLWGAGRGEGGGKGGKSTMSFTIDMYLCSCSIYCVLFCWYPLCSRKEHCCVIHRQ